MGAIAVIHDGESNFLAFSGRGWVLGGNGDIFEGTYPNAVRMARKAPRDNRRIIVSTDYGMATQEDREIGIEGGIGKPRRPYCEDGTPNRE